MTIVFIAVFLANGWLYLKFPHSLIGSFASVLLGNKQTKRRIASMKSYCFKRRIAHMQPLPIAICINLGPLEILKILFFNLPFPNILTH